MRPRFVQAITPADIYTVYLERLNLSAKVSFFIEHLREFFQREAWK